MRMVLIGLCFVGGLASILVAIATAMFGVSQQRPRHSEVHGSE